MEGTEKVQRRIANLQKDLRLRVSHVACSWRSRTPSSLAGEIARPKFCLNIGVVGGDEIHERRSTEHELRIEQQFDQRGGTKTAHEFPFDVL